MKVSIKNNLLTVTTGIKEAAAENKKRFVATDDKQNQLYVVQHEQGATASLCAAGMVTNAVVDGELAAQILLNSDRPQDYVRKTYGKSLIAAKKYLGIIVANEDAEVAALDEIMSEVEQ